MKQSYLGLVSASVTMCVSSPPHLIWLLVLFSFSISSTSPQHRLVTGRQMHHECKAGFIRLCHVTLLGLMPYAFSKIYIERLQERLTYHV